MEFKGFRKGQGATEYLVLLAVVLIVAMVAIALLGFFPGLAGDAKIAQSDAYWRGTARPFSILEHSFTGTTLRLIIQNTEADQRRVTNISVGSTQYATTVPSSYVPGTGSAFYSAGEKHNETITMTTACTAGNTYELYVNFTYSNADGSITGIKQYGEKTLVGKCS
jgi:hypothetical protein